MYYINCTWVKIIYDYNKYIKIQYKKIIGIISGKYSKIDLKYTCLNKRHPSLRTATFGPGVKVINAKAKLNGIAY